MSEEFNVTSNRNELETAQIIPNELYNEFLVLKDLCLHIESLLKINKNIYSFKYEHSRATDRTHKLVVAYKLISDNVDMKVMYAELENWKILQNEDGSLHCISKDFLNS